MFTGAYAINPVNGKPVPIWVADYVLISYGTGAIMAVPAHDTRDFEFAKQFDIPVVAVVDPGDASDIDRDAVLAGDACATIDGVAVNSGEYDGLSTPEFKAKIAADLTQRGQGRAAVNYKLRDWLFSRQHFWGEPFPILRELDDEGNPTGAVRAVPVSELPIDLPEMPNFKEQQGSPEPPLEQAPQDWLYVTIDGKRYKRETNTMPQWAGSCWYYLRFLDPKNSEMLIDPEIEKAWMPIDLYVGGAEHAVLHLLYARFWHKVLYDRGYVSTKEPFHKLVNQGMILGQMEFTGHKTQDGAWVSVSDVGTDAEGNSVVKASGAAVTAEKVSPDAVEKKGEGFVLKEDAQVKIDSRAHKMSKSRGNVVNPDEVVEQYGADSLRLYEMFMGPLEAVKPWSMEGVNGVYGFLNRVWRMIVDERAEEETVLNPAVQDIAPTEEQNRMLHKTIKAVTQDVDGMAFNTAIARMMEFTNFFLKEEVRPKSAMESFVLLLSPYAPHLCEELWNLLGHADTLAYHAWPEFDEAALVENTMEIPVQVNGKLRGKVVVPVDAAKDAILEAAKGDSQVAGWLEGKSLVKEIVVPGRLVNFVVK